DRSGSVPAYASAFDPTTRRNTVQVTPLENLESLYALRGRDIEFRSGGGYSVGLTGALNPELTVDRGRTFALEFTQDANGVVQPAQMQDLYAASVYKGLDSVATLVRSRGYLPQQRIQVFMNPHLETVISGDARSQLMDNAAYDFVHNVFLVLPNYMLQGRPLLLNYGVLSHEFGHSVIHQLINPDGFDQANQTVPISAVHEGVADLFGLAATGDPDFIRDSVDFVDRDLSVPLNYTDADYAELRAATSVLSGVDPHRHGSFLARAIYESWPKDASGEISSASMEALLDTTLTALTRFGASGRKGEFAGFANTWVESVPTSLRPSTCQVFVERLAPLALPACGGAP
ncbi:MAG: hypothetical protein ACT4TC_20740, partial [Myxococcaceae bacterium]